MTGTDGIGKAGVRRIRNLTNPWRKGFLPRPFFARGGKPFSSLCAKRFRGPGVRDTRETPAVCGLSLKWPTTSSAQPPRYATDIKTDKTDKTDKNNKNNKTVAKCARNNVLLCFSDSKLLMYQRLKLKVNNALCLNYYLKTWFYPKHPSPQTTYKTNLT